MNKLYISTRLIGTLVLVSLLSACSKDFLKSYDDRILGTWHVRGVNRVGFGGDSDRLPFRDGTFVFYEDGTLEYHRAGQGYSGTWDIEKRYYNDDDVVRILKITAVNFNTQQIISQYYDDMQFAGTDHFKATVRTGFHTYVTHFRR